MLDNLLILYRLCTHSERFDYVSLLLRYGPLGLNIDDLFLW